MTDSLDCLATSNTFSHPSVTCSGQRLSSSPRGCIWNREQNLLGPQTVYSNDPMHNRRNWGYQKKALPAPENGSYTDALIKKAFFKDKQTISSTQSWCFERTSRTENSFTVMHPLGPFVYCQKIKKGPVSRFFMFKESFQVYKAACQYTLSHLMLATALKE